MIIFKKKFKGGPSELKIFNFHEPLCPYCKLVFKCGQDKILWNKGPILFSFFGQVEFHSLQPVSNKCDLVGIWPSSYLFTITDLPSQISKI